MQLIKRFVDDNEHLELLSDAKNIDHADVFYDIVAGHAQEFLSVGDTDATESPAIVLAPKSLLGQLAPEEVEALRWVYSKMYGNVSWSDNDIPTTVKKFSHVTWRGKQITSLLFKSSHHVPYVYANYSCRTECLDLRPAKVLYYMQHCVAINSSTLLQPHIFAVVCWPQNHPARTKLGKPVEVWCKELSFRRKAIGSTWNLPFCQRWSHRFLVPYFLIILQKVTKL